MNDESMGRICRGMMDVGLNKKKVTRYKDKWEEKKKKKGQVHAIVCRRTMIKE